MKNIIDKLKILAEDIQSAKHGKRGEEFHVNSYAVIDEYHEWRAESEDFFSQYYDDSNSQYKQFIKYVPSGNGHVLMHYFDLQYPIFKVLIKKIEANEVSKLVSKKPMESNNTSTIMKNIFISHAIKDRVIVNDFVDIILVGGLSVPIDQIFCVSTDGTKIKSGIDWRDSIKENLICAKINFLMITPNYKESEVCHNEMGAAWVTCGNVIPLIIEPINYRTVGVIQEPKQIEKLLDEKSLDRIKDIVQHELKIKSSLIKSDRWTTKKNEFIQRVKKHIAENPFQIPIDRAGYMQLLKNNDDLIKIIDGLKKENSELIDLNKELKRTKDKAEVEVIIRKRKPTNLFSEFEELCNNVHNELMPFPDIILGIIFKSYTGKEVSIKWEGYKDELDDAVANDYINEDLEVDWNTTNEMKVVELALNAVSKFLKKDLDEEFYESFENKFKSPLKMDNKKFWEEAFEINIYF